MARIRHTRRRTKHKRKHRKRRTRRRRTRRRGGSVEVAPVGVLLGGGAKSGGAIGVVGTINPKVGGRKLKGGKKYKFPTYMISDISPGDKKAMSSDRRKFKKWKESLKRKKKK